MVQQIDVKAEVKSISPDFIYNRADLFCKDFVLLNVRNNMNDYLVEVQLLGNHAELGIWMMKVTGEEFDEISNFIFAKYKEIEYLSFYYAISDRVYIKGNHYHVVLPESYEILKACISAKSRNTMNRKRKKAEVDYGKIEMVECEKDDISDDIISVYFDMKEKTHHINNQLTKSEYISKYHVSNVYVLYFGEIVAAIIITCEQCSIAYLENLTYDKKLSKYSPGMMAYEMVLEKLISKGKTAFYLGGGDYDYKKKYDSVETVVTDGKIYRSWFFELKYRCIDFYNKHLYWKIRCRKRKLSV